MARPIRSSTAAGALHVLAAAAVSLLLTSCFETRTIECQGGVVCPEGSVCTADGLGCTTDSCGNGTVDSGEECDDGNQLDNDDCLRDCTNATCGDGKVNTEGENPEECDDFAANTASCDSDCTVPVCGDNLHNAAAGEACDDGDTDDADGCKGDCTSTEACGNGVIDSHLPNNPTNSPANCLSATATGNNCAEVCDDGNNLAGDGCSPNCLSEEECPNGILDVGEVCDDGDNDNNDSCRNDCTGGAGCGNGQVEAPLGEQCDNGMENQNSLTCDRDCTVPVCGDGLLNMSLNAMNQPLEQCDPGTPTMPRIGQPSASCNANCTTPRCGDSIVNDQFTPPGSTLTENCDDGNTTPGDGCDGLCRIEGCGNGVTETSRGEQCDDGNMNDLDACRNNCQLPRCGDGIASTPPHEVCDTNGNTSTCDFDCTAPMCGDGVINTMFIPTGGTLPEACDDGNTMGGDGCSALCRIENCGNGITEASNGEQCDDGNMNDLDGCRNNCRLPACGDGVQSASEFCETTVNTLTCDIDCTMPACNDGVLNTAAGEQCEDGNLNNGDGCSSTCRLESATLNVVRNGTGTGSVTSSPAGINCGGDCAESYTPGQMVTLTATATGTSVFTGWSGGGCTGTAPCVVTMDATKTVTATFDLNTLTVVKSGTGTGTVTSSPAGVNCGSDCTESYAAGTMVTLTASADSTATFTGWSGGGCTGTAPCVVTMNGATTVTATFTLQTFTLAVAKAGSGTGTVQSIPAGIDCGSTCMFGFTANSTVTLVATADSTSTFTSWSGTGINCPGTGNCTVTMSQARNVTATFTIRTVTLTANKAGSGTGTVTSSPSGISCNSGCSSDDGTFNAGSMVTLTATASAGDIFAGWSGGGCSGTAPCVITVSSAATITATFNDNRVQIVRVGDGSGTVTGPSGHGGGNAGNGISCGSNCYDDYNPGTSVTLTATPATGSRFGSWIDGPCAGSTVNTCTFNVNAPVTIEVEFIDLDTLTLNKGGNGVGTVTSNPAGINCGVACNSQSAPFDDGTTVTLTAVAATGSTFTGWSGAGCAGTGTCVINSLQSDQTVTATFALAGTVTINKTGTGSANGTVTSTNPAGGISCGADCSEVYSNGTNLTLSATVMAGTVFTGWSGGSGTCTGTTTPCTFTVAGDATLTANFELLRALTVSKAGTGMANGTVTSNPAGINCGGTCMANFANGTSVTLTASANAGTVFTGWSGAGINCPGTGTCVVSMTAAQSVTATFELQRTLTVSKNGSGTGTVSSAPAGINCGGTCSAPFANGTSVTLSAVADPMMVFTGWSGEGCAGTGACVVSMTQARNVTATFHAIRTLTVTANGMGTVTSNPAGITCGTGGADCTEAVTNGTAITLTATPEAGWVFVGYSGDCTGTTCNLPMTADASVTATFAQLFTLDVTVAGTGSVSAGSGTIMNCTSAGGAACTGSYSGNVTLTASGGTLMSWSGGGCSGMAATCVVPMTMAQSVTATFSP